MRGVETGGTARRLDFPVALAGEASEMKEKSEMSGIDEGTFAGVNAGAAALEACMLIPLYGSKAKLSTAVGGLRISFASRDDGADVEAVGLCMLTP